MTYNLFLAVRNIELAKKSIESQINDQIKLKKVHYFKCDISDMNSVENFAKSLKEKFYAINLLINNGKIRGWDTCRKIFK